MRIARKKATIASVKLDGKERREGRGRKWREGGSEGGRVGSKFGVLERGLFGQLKTIPETQLFRPKDRRKSVQQIVFVPHCTLGMNGRG